MWVHEHGTEQRDMLAKSVTFQFWGGGRFKNTNLKFLLGSHILLNLARFVISTPPADVFVNVSAGGVEMFTCDYSKY